jgi:hypothetical protein
MTVRRYQRSLPRKTVMEARGNVNCVSALASTDETAGGPSGSA